MREFSRINNTWAVIFFSSFGETKVSLLFLGVSGGAWIQSSFKAATQTIEVNYQRQCYCAKRLKGNYRWRDFKGVLRLHFCVVLHLTQKPQLNFNVGPHSVCDYISGRVIKQSSDIYMAVLIGKLWWYGLLYVFRIVFPVPSFDLIRLPLLFDRRSSQSATVAAWL